MVSQCLEVSDYQDDVIDVLMVGHVQAVDACTRALHVVRESRLRMTSFHKVW